LHNNLQPGQDILQLSGAVSGAAPLFTWVTASDDYQKIVLVGLARLVLNSAGAGAGGLEFSAAQFLTQAIFNQTSESMYAKKQE
jgi:hypothetical protein